MLFSLLRKKKKKRKNLATNAKGELPSDHIQEKKAVWMTTLLQRRKRECLWKREQGKKKEGEKGEFPINIIRGGALN